MIKIKATIWLKAIFFPLLFTPPFLIFSLFFGFQRWLSFPFICLQLPWVTQDEKKTQSDALALHANTSTQLWATRALSQFLHRGRAHCGWRKEERWFIKIVCGSVCLVNISPNNQTQESCGGQIYSRSKGASDMIYIYLVSSALSLRPLSSTKQVFGLNHYCFPLFSYVKNIKRWIFPTLRNFPNTAATFFHQMSPSKGESLFTHYCSEGTQATNGLRELNEVLIMNVVIKFPPGAVTKTQLTSPHL